MSDRLSAAKKFFNQYRDALYNCTESKLADRLTDLSSEECAVRLANPMGDVRGAKELYEVGFAPLLSAIPDLERRDYVVVAGYQGDEVWIGCGGNYMGVFERPWLGIPPTGHLVTMRFIEFFRIDDDRIVESKL